MHATRAIISNRSSFVAFYAIFEAGNSEMV